MKNRYIILTVAILLFAVFLLTTGFCDIDWMINSYHNNDWSGCDIWWFSTTYTMEWWTAYMITINKVIVGAFLLGSVCMLILYNNMMQNIVINELILVIKGGDKNETEQ